MAFVKPKNLEAFRKEVGEFVLNELEPIAEKIEQTRRFDWEDVQKLLRKKGLLSLTATEEWGGMGLNTTEYLPFLEEMSKTHGSIRGVMHQTNRSWQIIERYGTDDQKKKWLPRLCAGKATRTIAMTEPDAGSGVDIKTTAVRSGDKYILNGRKHFASSGNIAQPLMVWAYTDKSKGRRGISCIIVGDMKEGPPPAGLSMKNLPPMMGNTGSYHGLLTLENVEVPVENLLGKEGQGLDMFLEFIAHSRVSIATICLGISQRLLDLSVDFSKKRVTFGKPISKRQAVQTMLADMAIDIYALRTMIQDCARKIDQASETVAECSMCKLFGIETTRRVSDNALLIHGGIGYTRAYPVERLYRDARSLWLEEGTPTIHRLVISRELLGSNRV